MTRFAVLLFALGLVLAPARRAAAAPMVTELAVVRAESRAVVIGTVGPDLTIDVDTVLRGDFALGPRKMKPSPDGTARASGRVIAFLDKDGSFRWVGTLIVGARLETGILRIAGFYDRNAHLVRPGTMTFAQLGDYLAGGALVQKVAASISVADRSGGYLATGSRFVLSYDPAANVTTVAGLQGRCLGEPRVLGLEWNSLWIVFQATCDESWTRGLDLRGQLTGVDANGAMTAEVAVTQPFLDVTELATFMNDPTLSTIQHLVEVRLSDGTMWSWDPEVALADPRGTKYPLTMVSRGESRDGSVEARYGFDHGPAIALKSARALTVLEIVDRKSGLDICVFEETGKADRACTLTRGRTKIVKRGDLPRTF